MGLLTMAGKLDEISEAIGGLRAQFSSLDGKIDDNRDVADERHQENQKRLVAIEQTTASLAADRRAAMVIISVVTGAIMWAISLVIGPILTKMGWK